jgi:uncharacterized membrane protein YkvA (DUF1232 family)
MEMKEITQEQAEGELYKKAEKVTEDDLQKVLNNQAGIESKFRDNGPLIRFISDLKLLFGIIRDYIKGEYREIPWWSIAAIVASLLYVLSPIDLIPDFIPGRGYVDDAMVVASCLSMVRKDLQKYEEWKTNHT